MRSRAALLSARREDGGAIEFEVSAWIETPQEVLYIRHGGILQYVLRRLLGGRSEHVPVPARKPHPLPTVDHDGAVDEGSIQSLPASDPVSYTGSTRL